MSKEKPILSILVSVYNEEEVIETFLKAVRPHIDEAFKKNKITGSTEIIFIDDGSYDKTVEIIETFTAKDPSIKLVKLSKNFGKDAAVTAGLSYASGQAVVPMDVDLQDPPEILTDMMRLWKNGAKIVNAKRANRESDGYFKRLTAGLFYKLYNKISKSKIDENVGDYRLLDRQVVDAINQMPEKIRFMKGIFSWVGFPKETVEYVRTERIAGESKWRFWDLWNFALDGFTGATTVPLRIWTYCGLLISFLSFLYAAYVVVKTLIFGSDVAGYPSLMVAILFFGGVNMVAIGIIGEYIGRISIEVKNRPIFLVESTTNIQSEK